jgi:3-oxoacyl-[acyl-carrier protein] reductase
MLEEKIRDIAINSVITGGTRGIGLGMAMCLVKRGASVALTYHRNRKAAETARSTLSNLAGDGQTVLILEGDAGLPETVDAHYKQVRDELGPVSVLVNNAGIMPQRSFEQITDREWDETIRVNLGSTFYWSSRVVPDMKALGFGRIINISSVAARGGGVVGPHYAASKAGILGLTRYAARELGSYGITVNAILPAFIGDAGIFVDWDEQKKASLSGKVVTSRIGEVSDVVRAFEYLLDSPYVTGAGLDVCGGATMS